MNRGANKQIVFPDDESCGMFLALIEEVVGRYDFVVHGYALMPNHFHLMVQTPRGNLSHGMRHLLSYYALWLNRHRGWDGPVFRGRYKSRLVEDDIYWLHLLAYLHLNPVKAGLVRRVDEARWTSHEAYAGTVEMPTWLTVGELLSFYDGLGGYHSYITQVRNGSEPGPDSFDSDHFFAPMRKEALERAAEEHRDVEVVTFTADQALQAVRLVTGMRETDLLKARLGRGGAPERWLAMWWLSRSARLTQGEISQMFGTTRPTVSRSIARVRKSLHLRTELGEQARRLLDLLS
jgi:REP element-mobilizing transposase RayT